MFAEQELICVLNIYLITTLTFVTIDTTQLITFQYPMLLQSIHVICQYTVYIPLIHSEKVRCMCVWSLLGHMSLVLAQTGKFYVTVYLHF